MRKNLGILLSFLLFAAAPSAFAQAGGDGSTGGSESTNGGVNSRTQDGAGTSDDAEVCYALPKESLRQLREENGRKIYTVELNWEQGRLYNQLVDNVESSRFLAQWFNYDHPTMNINAVYNNFALGGALGKPYEADANGNIPMSLHYGIAHAPVTITAPRGWKLTKVTIDGKALGTTAKVISSNGRYILHNEDDHNRPASAWDAVASAMGNYRYSIDTAKYEVIGTTEADGTPSDGKSEFGKVHAFFLPDNYVWPTKAERENDTDPTYASIEALKDSGYHVNHFEWIPEEDTNQFQFHLNGDNTGIQAVFQVSFEQCDSVENVNFHVLDGNDDNKKELTPSDGLVRTLRLAYNGEATVPQDFDRSFCTYTWCDESGDTISAAEAAEKAKAANVQDKNIYLKLTRDDNYPFRIASIPEGDKALTPDSASVSLRNAGFYYINIGNTHFLKASKDVSNIQLEADTKNQSDEWFAIGKGDAFNGWKLMNFNDPTKYLTVAAKDFAEGSDHALKDFAEGSDHALSFKDEPDDGERNLWIPLTAKYSHETGHDMNADHPALGVAMRSNAFFLVPVKAESKDFEEDKMRWQLTALKNVDGAENAAEKQLVARTGHKARFTQEGYVRDERNDKSRILLHEITDVDVKVVNNADDTDVWAYFEDGLRLKHVCELQTILLHQNLPIVKASKAGRDYCVYADTIFGTATDQLHVDGEDGEDGEGGKTLRATFELFNVSTNTEAPEYKYFIKAAPRLQREIDGNVDANHTYLYNDTKNSTIKAITAGAILPIDQRKDEKYQWFFTGNPYQGFVCYNTADGKVLQIDENALSMVGSEEGAIALRPDSAYLPGYEEHGTEALIDATEEMTYYNTLPRGAQALGGAMMRQCFNLVRQTKADGEAASTYLEQAWPSLALNTSGSGDTITGAVNDLRVRTNAADALSEFILLPTDEDIHYFILRKKGDNTRREYADTITEVVSSNDSKTIDLREWIRDYCTYTCTTGDSDANDENLSFTLPEDRNDKGSSTYGTSRRGLTYAITGTGSSEDFTHVIEWTWDGPFELSTETDKHWYLVKCNGNYILANNGAATVTPAGWNNENKTGTYQGLDANYGPKHVVNTGCVFAFIGNPYDGFYINSIKGDNQYLHFASQQNIGTTKQLFHLYEAAQRQEDGSFDPRFCFEGDGTGRFLYTHGWTSRTPQEFYTSFYNQAVQCQYTVDDPRPTMKRFFDHLLEAPKGTIYGLTDTYYDEWKGNTEKILSYDGAAVKTLFETEKAIGAPASLDEFKQYHNTIKANTPYRLISVGRELSGSTNYVSMVNGYTADHQLHIDEVSGSTREDAEAKALTNPSTVFVSGTLAGYGTSVGDFGWQRVEGGMRTQGLKIQTTASDAAVSLGNNNPANFFVDYANNCQATCSPYAVVRTGSNYFNVDSDGTIKGVTDGRTTTAACFYIVPATEFKGTIGARGKTSFYLDFPVEIPSEGITEAWYVTSIGDFDGTTDGTATTATIDAGTILPKGTPFFVTGTPGSEVTFSIHDEASADTATAPKGNLLSGKYLPQSYDRETANNIIYSYGQSATSKKIGFFKYLGTTIPANRAFLTLARENAASGVNFFSLIDGGESTGIGSVEVPQTDPAVIYDMQGRRVAQPTRNGLYIVNGKKVYLKAN